MHAPALTPRGWRVWRHTGRATWLGALLTVFAVGVSLALVTTRVGDEVISIAPSAPSAPWSRDQAGGTASGVTDAAGATSKELANGYAIGGEGLADLATGRPVIQIGTVDLVVRSVPDAFEETGALVARHGGVLADSTFTSAKEAGGVARLTVRVPADRFSETVAALRGLALEVQSVTTSSRDVAEEMTDLDATLRNLGAVETRYIALLDQAKSIGEVLQVQDRLNQVRLQIDRTQARRQLLTSQAEMSTLSVTLRPAEGAHGDSGPLARAAEAWDGSLRLLREMATLALVAVAYSWWALALGAAAVLVGRRWRRRDTSTVSSEG